MTTNTETTVSNLATPASNAVIPTETKEETSGPCATNDKECMNRWISAFSDCA